MIGISRLLFLGMHLMNCPATDSGVSTKDLICLTGASGEISDFALRNKNFYNSFTKYQTVVIDIIRSLFYYPPCLKLRFSLVSRKAGMSLPGLSHFLG